MCCADKPGIPEENIFPISAATGKGLEPLVRAVRRVLNELGEHKIKYSTDALNIQEVRSSSRSSSSWGRSLCLIPCLGSGLAMVLLLAPHCRALALPTFHLPQPL